jgi:hypothetical protein
MAKVEKNEAIKVVKEEAKKADPTLEKRNEKEKVTNNRLFVEIDNGVTQSEVLKYNQEGYNLRFVPEDLPSYDDEFIYSLSRENQKQYFVAQGLRRAYERAAKSGAHSGPKVEIVEDPFQVRNRAAKKEALPQKPGMHRLFMRDDELDDALKVGYQPVRDEASGEVISYEETLKKSGTRIRRQAMEVSDKLYAQHELHNSLKSRMRIRDNMSKAKKEFVEIGNQIPGSGTVEAVDTSHEFVARKVQNGGNIDEE